MSVKRIILVLATIAAMSIFGYIGFADAVKTKDSLEFQKVELNSKQSEIKELNVKYEQLNQDLDKATEQKGENQEEVERLQKEKEQLEQQKRDLEAQLQAKLEQKSKLAQASEQIVNTATLTQTAYAESGSGCEWLKGKLANMGVSSGDIPAAISIAQKESNCRPVAQNPGGACNIFQELPCGKWGGLSNTDAHLQGAITYANNRYGGWWQAHSFWQENKWW